MTNKNVVHAYRGEMIESSHNVHVAVVNRGGIVTASVGNPVLRTFARSAAKPLQATAVLRAGALERFSMTMEETALLAASHNGEPGHVRTVAGLLRKMGLDETALQCGIHPSLHGYTRDRMVQNGEKPSTLHNNCSGKHAGMLALSLILGADPDHYMAPEHPVQQIMLETVSLFSGLPASSIHLGTDGCGVPVFGLPLDRLAYAYARFGRPDDDLPDDVASAAQVMRNAIRHRPFYLAGSDRFDTRLIESTAGRWIGKMGAEGVFALTNSDSGTGIAVKIEDGNERALYPAVVEVLAQLDLISDKEREQLASFHHPGIVNHRGNPVGQVVPDLELAHLAH